MKRLVFLDNIITVLLRENFEPLLFNVLRIFMDLVLLDNVHYPKLLNFYQTPTCILFKLDCRTKANAAFLCNYEVMHILQKLKDNTQKKHKREGSLATVTYEVQYYKHMYLNHKTFIIMLTLVIKLALDVTSLYLH